ncbi:hypothetical protein ACFFX0_01040 [Citricoccus parietis]|uniref:Uncharacterized protein n=1 Tax=Citricoccus parietis TaxID=592307 RepID=A0ABV5FT57_9MICC
MPTPAPSWSSRHHSSRRCRNGPGPLTPPRVTFRPRPIEARSPVSRW